MSRIVVSQIVSLDGVIEDPVGIETLAVARRRLRRQINEMPK
jgi:hypothetical protein